MPSTDERKQNLDQSQLLDDSIVYENDDDDASKGEEDTNIKQMISPSKSTATNATTPTSPDGSFVQDWNVVETLIEDSSSEFSDAECYELDLVEEGAIDEEDMINKHNNNGIVSSICSIDSDDGSCSDFDENNELLEDNDLPSNHLVAEDEFDSGELVEVDSRTKDKHTKGVEVSVVIENPPSVGDSSDFEDEEDEDESLGLDDGVIVAEDGIVVVVEDDDLAAAYNTTTKIVGKDSTAYLVPPMRQIPRLNNLIRSGVEGRAAK